MFDLGLTSTHTLITGASGGLGLELVHQFLSQNALVTAHYNSNPAGLDSLPSDPSSLVRVQADVQEEAQVERLFVEARDGMNGRGVEVLVGEYASPQRKREEGRERRKARRDGELAKKG